MGRAQTSLDVHRRRDVDLERLIATEQRLDEALRTAREQAGAMIQEAQARARAQAAALDTELQQAALRLSAETTAERERREHEVAREAEARVALLDAVSAARVEQAARQVVARLVAGEAAP
jgi:vacuolar-type H+-ATPase subunit H